MVRHVKQRHACTVALASSAVVESLRARLWGVVTPGPVRLSGGRTVAAGLAGAGLGAGEREPGHVGPAGGFGAAAYLGVGRGGVGFAGLTLEPSQEPGLAAGGVRGGVLTGPAGVGGL